MNTSKLSWSEIFENKPLLAQKTYLKGWDFSLWQENYRANILIALSPLTVHTIDLCHFTDPASKNKNDWYKERHNCGENINPLMPIVTFSCDILWNMVSQYVVSQLAVTGWTRAWDKKLRAGVNLSLCFKNIAQVYWWLTLIFMQVASCFAGLRSSWCTRLEPSVWRVPSLPLSWAPSPGWATSTALSTPSSTPSSTQSSRNSSRNVSAPAADARFPSADAEQKSSTGLIWNSEVSILASQITSGLPAWCGWFIVSGQQEEHAVTLLLVIYIYHFWVRSISWWCTFLILWDCCQK